MRRRPAVFIVTSVLVVGAACSSSDDAGPTTSTESGATTDTEAPATSTTESAVTTGSSSPATSTAGPGATTCPGDTTLSDLLCVAADPRAEEVAEAVLAAFEEDALGATIVGVWQDGEPLVVGALGESPPGAPASADMSHITGNLSTAILTTALLQQVDAGVLALTDTLSTWYPDLPSADAVTVEMLAHSTTGYSHYPANPDFQQAFYADPFTAWNPDDLIAYGVAGGPAFTPGTDFLFSDTNHMILQQVLAKATGRSVGELVQDGILDPLGMTNTTPPEPGALRAPVLHSYTGERNVWEEGTFWNPTWIGYVGGWGSDLEDMRTFVDALGSGELLSEASFEAQFAPTTVGMGDNTAEKYRAMGLNVVNGWSFMGPGLQGLQAGIANLPDEKLTIIIYTTLTPQADATTSHAAELAAQLTGILAPDQPVTL